MKDLMLNPILNADSYKASHFLQYPEDTQITESYGEMRSDKVFKGAPIIGLNYLLKKIINNPITADHVAQAAEFFTAHGEPFNSEGWNIVVNEFGGLPPLDIRAVPEGTIVPVRNVCFTVSNTVPNRAVAALTSYYETQILRGLWYASTVAAISREVRKMYKEWLTETSDLTGQDFEMKSLFALNDFGSRGVSSFESSAIGGFGHLTNSMGTDNLPAIALANDYYGSDMAGYSIPASEHSTVTSWPGKGKGEVDALRNHIKNFGSKEKNPTGLYAFVSDSYDLYKFVNEVIGVELKDEILAQDNTLVVRPDSGDPLVVVPNVLDILYTRFGGHENSKGRKVLNEKVRVIQGDGITLESIPGLLAAISTRGFSTENVVFGMGGGLLQQVNRDTLGWAMKCSHIVIAGVPFQVFKDPATDPGKVSKKGPQALINTPQGLQTINRDDLGGKENLLIPTYRDGELLVDPTLDEIRQRCAV